MLNIYLICNYNIYLVYADGTLKGGVNGKGVAYYNELINMLIDNGIVTVSLYLYV